MNLINNDEVARIGEGRQDGRHGRQVVAVDDALLKECQGNGRDFTEKSSEEGLNGNVSQ